jgi:hypothetical protein
MKKLTRQGIFFFLFMLACPVLFTGFDFLMAQNLQDAGADAAGAGGPAGDGTGFQFAILKYGGGGDWYTGQTGVRNLLLYCQRNTDLKLSLREKVVTLLDDDLFQYPFLYVNGHGNMFFNDREVIRLRTYLENGGFLFVNDCFGLDPAFRRELKKVFPDKDLVEVPLSYPVYHCFYNMTAGPPKVHKHEGGPPVGYGLFLDGRMVLYYDYDSDISDGWEEQWVHNDPPEVREMALKMGVNIIYFSMLY